MSADKKQIQVDHNYQPYRVGATLLITRCLCQSDADVKALVGTNLRHVM